jgi:hypothetical protein
LPTRSLPSSLLGKLRPHLSINSLDGAGFIPEKELERVRIDGHFAIKLKDHQVKGIKFMWDNCFESVEKSERTLDLDPF